MSNKQLSTIAKNIRKHRKEKNFSQDRLSKEAEVAYNTIVKIESGENPNPTVDTLERIAKALGVSIEILFRK
jgi:transcriptional regulator with XRE-family HTH domain